jgi:hypothetical protein
VLYWICTEMFLPSTGPKLKLQASMGSYALSTTLSYVFRIFTLTWVDRHITCSTAKVKLPLCTTLRRIWRGVTPLTPTHGTRWVPVVSLHVQAPLSPRKIRRYQINGQMGGPHSRPQRYGEEDFLPPPEIETRFFGCPGCTLVTGQTTLSLPITKQGRLEITWP